MHGFTVSECGTTMLISVFVKGCGICTLIDHMSGRGPLKEPSVLPPWYGSIFVEVVLFSVHVLILY